MKWHWNHVEWGEWRRPGAWSPVEYQFYIWWAPHWLGPTLRHVGIERYYIDGPHVSLGFWFFNITWSTWRSLPPFDTCSTKYQARWAARPRWLRRLFGML